MSHRLRCWRALRWIVTGLALSVLLWAGHGAFVLAAPAPGVELSVAGEGSVTVAHQAVGGVSQTTGVLAGRLELRLYPGAASPWWAELTVEPWLPLDSSGVSEAPPGSIAVTEAHAGFRFPTADVYVGRFQLPVETGRLAVPFTLTSYDAAGRRQGVDGVRADVYLCSGRLQVAAVQAGQQWTPLIGWRQQLVGWEATGYVLWKEHGPAAGVGASGLVRSTVVYGEAWSLPGEQRLRGSVGATGYLGDSLWTVELARASFPAAQTSGPRAPAVPLAAAQLAHAFPSGWTVVADAAAVLRDETPAAGPALGKQDRPHHLRVSVTYELLPGQAEVELSVRRQVRPPQPDVLGAAVGLRWFF